MVKSLLIFCLAAVLMRESLAGLCGDGITGCDGCQCCPDLTSCPNGHDCPAGFRCPNDPPDGPKTSTKPTPTPTPEPQGSTASTKPYVPTNGSCSSYPCLYFQDTFDTFDMNLWYHEENCWGGGNGEFQCYVNDRANSFVKDGVLHMRATADGDLRSARLITQQSFTYRYGRFEIRAKLPQGDWLWPAIWLLPRDSYYGIWPASGEIDIVESRGNPGLWDGVTNIGVNQFGATLHWGPHWPYDAWAAAHSRYNAPNNALLSDDWHTYRLDWDKNGMKVFIDDHEMFQIETGNGYYAKGGFHGPDAPNVWAEKGGELDAPFDKPFFIVLNVAIGGTNGYFPDGPRNDGSPKPWSNGDWNAKSTFMGQKGNWYPSLALRTARGNKAAAVCTCTCQVLAHARGKQYIKPDPWNPPASDDWIQPSPDPWNPPAPVPSPEDSQAVNGQCSTYPCLIFEDNFDQLDLGRWNHEVDCGGGGNGEFQCYVNDRANTFVKNGVLHLKATADGDIRSARINTQPSFAFRYGRMEVRAKMPQGDWIWPAIWLLPRDKFYGGWPSSGEIDINESRGNRGLFNGGENIGCNQFGTTLHWGPKWPFDAWGAAHSRYNLPGGRLLSDDWHTYRLDWDRNGMKVFIDDQQMFSTDTGAGYYAKGNFGSQGQPNIWAQKGGQQDAPFDKPFYIIFNVAVGGTNSYFPDGARNDGAPKPWNNGMGGESKGAFLAQKDSWYSTWPQDDRRDMQIDYVKVWKMSQDQDQ